MCATAQKGVLMNKILFSSVIVVFIILSSCANNSEDPTNILNYSVLRERKVSNETTIDIRINNEVDKVKITDFTRSYYKNITRTGNLIIIFYLPQMTIGEGGWASSQSDGSKVEVTILGFSKSQIDQISQNPKDNALGIWKWSSVGAMIYLRKDGNNYTLEMLFKDGKSLKKAVSLSRVSGIIVIRQKEKSGLGDYYKIGSKDDLEFWDDEGKSGSAAVEKPLVVDF
jgi:hypothetical protein